MFNYLICACLKVFVSKYRVINYFPLVLPFFYLIFVSYCYCYFCCCFIFVKPMAQIKAHWAFFPRPIGPFFQDPLCRPEIQQCRPRPAELPTVASITSFHVHGPVDGFSSPTLHASYWPFTQPCFLHGLLGNNVFHTK